MRVLRTIPPFAFLAGSAIYLAAEAVAASAWRAPTYSYASNWISDLGSATAGVFQGRLLNSPLHDVMNVGFIIQGLLLGIGTVLLSRTLVGRTRRFATVMGIVVTVGYLLVGTFHGSLQAQQNGTLPLHFTGAALAILGANLLSLVIGIYWRKVPETRLIGLVSVVLGSLGLAAATVLCLTFGAGLPSGLIERTSVYTIVLWQVAVAVSLLRNRPAKAAANMDAVAARSAN